MNVENYLPINYGAIGCWNLVVDVYHKELMENLIDYANPAASLSERAQSFRLAIHNGEHNFLQIDSPEDFCVVGMSNKLSSTLTHAGVYYKGGVLHALPEMNYYQDIHSLGDRYKQITYWKLC